jgi:PTS system galactitol-specific IIA component
VTGLAGLIRPDLVAIQGDAADAESLIRELGGRLVSAGDALPSLPDAAVERERTYPTGLLLADDGPNAALPHADREHVVRSAVAVATLRQPVVFHRMDAPAEPVPVRLVILLALAEAEGQLAALREAGALLQDPARVARLLEAATPEALIEILGEGAA